MAFPAKRCMGQDMVEDMIDQVIIVDVIHSRFVLQVKNIN